MVPSPAPALQAGAWSRNSCSGNGRSRVRGMHGADMPRTGGVEPSLSGIPYIPLLYASAQAAASKQQEACTA